MQLTKEQAVARIVAETPLSEGDVQGLLDCSPDELALIFQAINDRHQGIPRSTWDIVLEVLKVCADVAGLVLPLEGAIAGAVSLGKL